MTRHASPFSGWDGPLRAFSERDLLRTCEIWIGMQPAQEQQVLRRRFRSKKFRVEVKKLFEQKKISPSFASGWDAGWYASEPSDPK